MRRAFYRGDIASQILAHQRENDGLLSVADLESFRCQIVPSVSHRFRFNGEAVEVHTCGAWCQGPFLLEALSIAEAAGVRTQGHGTDAFLHTIAETLKLTLSDREAYLGDPDFVDVPLDALTGQTYAAERSRAIDPRKASPGMPPPGRISGHQAYVSSVAASDAPLEPPPDTSIVCVIDADGNALCSTPSDTSWDTPVVPGTGLAVSSRGAQSWAVRGHPSCLAPGKRPRLTPNPCFVLSPGRWIMPFGTPGGDAQIQANLQVLLGHLVFGMELQDAVEPRVSSPTVIPIPSRPTPRIPASSPSKGASTRQPATGSPRAVTALSAWMTGRTGPRAYARSARTSRQERSRAPPIPGARAGRWAGDLERPLALVDRDVVGGEVEHALQAVGRELPVLVAVCSVPLAGVAVAPLADESHRMRLAVKLQSSFFSL